jgi:hypothetical protein
MVGATFRALAALFCAVFACGAAGAAATMRVAAPVIVISGRFEPGDAATFGDLLKNNPSITTVVLYDSPGGNGTVMQRMSAMIRGHKLSTAVAGNCVSACAMIFLSGVQRYFADIVPVQDTSIGFHGSYLPDGTLTPERRLTMLAGMVESETGGKADPALVRHWLHFESRRSLVRFSYPGQDGKPDHPTVFECSGGQRYPTDYSACTPIPDHDALSMGIITTTQVLHIDL